MNKIIKYKKTVYKYYLTETIRFLLPELKEWKEDFSGFESYFTILERYNSRNEKNEAILRISEGYAWDGASGPAIDTKTNMTGSLVHDVIYQVIREKKGVKNSKKLRKVADKLLREICLANGMCWIRAQYFYLAVRIFGGIVVGLDKKNKVYKAPACIKK